MYLVRASYEILIYPTSALELIERAGRTCYKSEDRITSESASKFVHMLVHDYKHESVIEHSFLTVKFIIDRGVSHELVRHRLCSFSQESTRYCNYSKKGITFVIPPWIDIEPGEYKQASIKIDDLNTYNWLKVMILCETYYNILISNGWKPQQARSVLPNSLKTEIVVTANFREWRHILKLRTAKAAHPQIREVMCPLLTELKTLVPVIFDDITGE